MHYDAEFISAATVVVRLHHLRGMATLFKVRGELLGQVGCDVEVLPLNRCIKERFTQYLVEAVGVYFGFGRVECAIFLTAYQRHVSSRRVIAPSTSATPQEPVSHPRQSQQKESGRFFPQGTNCAYDRSSPRRSTPGSSE